MRKALRSLFEFPVLVQTLLAWAVTLFYAYAISQQPFVGPLRWAVSILPFGFVFPVATIIFETMVFPVRKSFLWRMISSYIALMLIFANLFFLLILVEPTRLARIHSPWAELGKLLYMRDALLAVIDCVHFSCVTITTLGYGDISPAHWLTKLLSNVEVLSGLVLVTIGFGRYFSSGLCAECGRRHS